MEPNLTQIEQELREQRIIIDKIYVSVEKTRKYILWTVIITSVVFVLPLIALMFVLPSVMSTYTSSLSGSSLGL